LFNPNTYQWLTVSLGFMEKTMRSGYRFCIIIIGFMVIFACPIIKAQSNQDWQAYKRSCRIPSGLDYSSWVSQGSHCPAREARNTNNNNNGVTDANAAAEAEAAAEAKRRQDAELEQQRIEAENQRLAQEAEKQAQFERNKREALGQLKGAANGNDLDSASGLKGVGSTDSGLKAPSSSSDPSGLKTLPDINTDPMVVNSQDLSTGLPKSVEAEIPHTPAGDRVRKGFQAIQAHDWKLALAWFKDALNHEPGNAGIERLVELAQFTMDRENRPHPPATPAPSTKVQAKAAPVDSNLASSIQAFNRNYNQKHPAAKPGANSNEEFLKQEDPAWVQFFRYITSLLPKTKADPNLHVGSLGGRA
jgi:hypothetical protein